MGRDSSDERRRVHQLLDLLPPEKVSALRGLLEVMVEPLSQTLAGVPVDNAELTAETVAAIGRARASVERGEGIAHEEILRELTRIGQP